MEKPYIVEFLSNIDEKKSKYSAPNFVDGLEIAKRLEALIIEKNSQGYKFVSTQIHNEYNAVVGYQPAGYLVFFKEI